MGKLSTEDCLLIEIWLEKNEIEAQWLEKNEIEAQLKCVVYQNKKEKTL